MILAMRHGMDHNPGMKTLIPMDPSGRLVLPKSIRQSLNIPPTVMFEAEVLGNRIELTVAEPKPAKLSRKGKLLVLPKQGVAVDTVAAVNLTRKDRL